MTATPHVQYIELGYKVVDDIKEFQSLKKEYEKLNDDLIEFKKSIKKNEKLFSAFKVVSHEVERKIQNAQFDTKYMLNLAKDLNRLQVFIKKAEKLSKQVREYSQFKNSVDKVNEIINFCYAKMQIFEIKKTTQKLDDLIQNIEVLILETGNKESRLNHLLNDIAENAKLWSEDSRYFENMLISLQEEIKTKDVNIEHLKTEIKEKKKEKDKQIEKFELSLQKDNFQDDYKEEINSFRSSFISKSDFESFIARVRGEMGLALRQREANKKRELYLKIAKYIGFALLGGLGLWLVIIFVIPFIVEWWWAILLVGAIIAYLISKAD